VGEPSTPPTELQGPEPPSAGASGPVPGAPLPNASVPGEPAAPAPPAERAPPAPVPPGFDPSAPPPLADEVEKQRQLERMQRNATGLLGVAAVVFAVARVLEARYPWVGYVRAASEAAVVGGVADWFAVTALFRHPLGLPIPHTAIVPRRKDRIGRSLGHFVQRNFLAREVVAAKLHDMQVGARLAGWLADPRARAPRRAAGRGRALRRRRRAARRRRPTLRRTVARHARAPRPGRAVPRPRARAPHRRRAATRSCSTRRCASPPSSSRRTTR
jgi:hypothetical protein